MEYDWNLRLEEMDESDDDLDYKVRYLTLRFALVICHSLKRGISSLKLYTIMHILWPYLIPFLSQARLRRIGGHRVSVTHPACLLMISSPFLLFLASVINHVFPTACSPIRYTAFPLTVLPLLSAMHHLYHLEMQGKVKQTLRELTSNSWYVNSKQEKCILCYK